MVYYRVTRWGTKLWCLLASYIEKYKVWQSNGEVRAKQGKAKVKQMRSKGEAKAKQRRSKAKQGEARRSKAKHGEAKARQRQSKAKQNICYRGITGGYLAGANLAGDFCGGKSAW
jgi:hypothetical protein